MKTFAMDDTTNLVFGRDACSHKLQPHLVLKLWSNGVEIPRREHIPLYHSDSDDLTHLYSLHMLGDGQYEAPE